MYTKTKLGVGVVTIAALALGIGMVVAGILFSAGDQAVLAADGYVLGIEQEQEESVVYLQSFAANTKLQKKIPSSYSYKDIEGDRVVVDEENFIHYSDGSFSALTDSIALDAATVNDSVIEFYDLDERMVLTKDGDGWSIDNNTSTLSFQELLWMINSDKLMAGAEGLTLNLANGESHEAESYLEITYLDQGIVQLACESGVWRTVASNTTVVYPSGAVLDLGERTLYNRGRTAGITLDEMAADMGSAVQVNSNSAGAWVPPTFQVTAESGKDGKDGEEGTSGEEGSEGDSGDKGGNGAEGDSGQTGATGGTPGTAGGSDDEVTVASSVGNIRLKTLNYTATTAKFTLEVLDDDGTLDHLTGGDIEIRDAKTNQLVWSYKQANQVEKLDVSTITNVTEFEVESGLNPDTEYILTLNYPYSISTAEGKTSGSKTFINRHFFTATDGVVIADVDNSITTESGTESAGLTVTVKKQDYSDAQAALIRFQVGDKWYDYMDNISSTTNSAEFQIDFSDSYLLDALGASTPGGDRADYLYDTEYTLTLYSGASGTSDFNDNDSDGEFDGAVQKSAQVITGRTLKKTPVFGKLQLENSNQGYYTLKQLVNEDLNKSITQYKFTVNKMGADNLDPVKSWEILSTNGTAAWYYDAEDAGTGTYEVISEVTWFDNETSVEKKIDSSTIIITLDGVPVISFDKYSLKVENGRYYAYNGNGEKVNTAHAGEFSGDPFARNQELFDASRIWGDLVINLNGAKVKEGQNLTITVTCDSNTYNKVISYPVAIESDGTTIRVPIQLVGLAQSGIYTFTVEGNVIRTVTVAGEPVENETYETLGRCFYRTEKYDTATAEDDSPALFLITQIGGGNSDEIAQVTLPSAAIYPNYADKNSNAASSKYYEARAAASAIRFDVYNTTGIKIGSFVKRLDEASNYDYENYEPAANGGADKYESYLYGPLVASRYGVEGAWKEDTRLVIKKSDLQAANVGDTGHGVYEIRAAALYDYSYVLSIDEPGYQQEYGSDGSDSRFNEIPIRSVNIIRNNQPTEDYFNRASIDLGLRPPTLPDTPEEAKAMVGTNNLTNGSSAATTNGASITKYGSNTSIGFLLTPNYDNTNGDISAITYYCMDYDDFRSYADTSGANTWDPVHGYWTAMDKADRTDDENVIRKNTGVKFAVELGNIGDTLPSLYVFAAEESIEYNSDTGDISYKDRLGNIITREQLKTANAGLYDSWEYDTDKKKWVANPTTDSDGNRVIIVPKNWMPRGHQYTFGLSIDMFYGTTNEDAWTYPFEINGYLEAEQYGSSDQLPRSEGADFKKEEPSIASYLYATRKRTDNTTDEVQSTWYFFVYDPDGALSKSGASYDLIATTSTEYQKYADNKLKDNKTPVSELTANISAVKTLAESNLGDRFSPANLFGEANKNWSAEDIKYFSVTVRDGTTMKVNSGDTYSIWFEKEMFDGEYSAVSDTMDYHTYCATNNIYGSFFQKTVTQKVFVPEDRYFTGENTGSDQSQLLEYQLVPSDSTEQVHVNVTGSSTYTNQIVALYYEVYANTGTVDTPQKGALLQCGTTNYSINGGADITMTHANPGDPVLVQLSPIYDTGYAVTNTEHAVSDEIFDPAVYGTDFGQIHEPTRISNSAVSVSNKYFAPQALGSGNYAARISVSSSNLGYNHLNFGQNYASNVLYKVALSGSADVGSLYRYSFEKQLRVGTETAQAIVYLGYGSEGGYNVKEKTAAYALKILKEAPANNLKGYDAGNTKVTIGKVGGSNYFVMEVPDRQPTVTSKVINNTVSPIKTTMTFNITPASYEMIKGEGYIGGNDEGRIYLEVLEADGEDANGIVYDISDNSATNQNHRFVDVTAQGYDSTNQKFRFFDTDVIKYDAEKDAAYIELPSGSAMTEGWTASDEGNKYNLTLNNLTPNRKYYVRLYTWKKDDNADTYDTKEYIVDGCSSDTLTSTNHDAYIEGASSNEYCVNFTKGKTISMGKLTYTGSTVLTAQYAMKNALLETLTVKFTSNGTSDVVYDVSIEDSLGKEIVSADEMMGMLDGGYQKKNQTASYWNYSTNQWDTAQDQSYYQTNDSGDETVFQEGTSYNYTREYQWSPGDSVAQKLEGGKVYRIVVTPRYENPLLNGMLAAANTPLTIDLRDEQGNITSGHKEDTSDFDIMKKADPNMAQTKVTIFRDTNESLYATIGMYVNDLSYRLGFCYDQNDADGNEDRDLRLGSYGVRIKYEELDMVGQMGKTDYVNPGDVSLSWTDNDGNPQQGNAETVGLVKDDNYIVLTADKRYNMTFPAEEGRQYYLEVYGYYMTNNYPDDVENNYDKYILSSKDVASLHAKLNIQDADLPRIEDSRIDLDESTGIMSITVYNGSNLDQINTVRLTVTGYSQDGNSEWTHSMSAVTKFTQIADSGGRTRHQMTANLTEILDTKASYGDALNISAYLYKDAELCLDNIQTYNNDSYNKPE